VHVESCGYVCILKQFCVQIVLKEADILATLPDISPNYHPLPQSLRNKTLVDIDDIGLRSLY
jgi:hypothetical protein